MKMRAVQGWMLKPDLPVPCNDLERMCEILYTMVWQADDKAARERADKRRAEKEASR